MNAKTNRDTWHYLTLSTLPDTPNPLTVGTDGAAMPVLLSELGEEDYIPGWIMEDFVGVN